MKKILIGITSAIVSVNVALAQNTSFSVTIGSANQNVGGSLSSLIKMIQGLVNQVSVLAYGVATLAFFWFLIQLILTKGDPIKTKDSLKGMGWSIGALFLMYAIFGVISFISATTGVGVGGGGNGLLPIIPSGPAI